MKKINITLPGHSYDVVAGKGVFKKLIPGIRSADLYRKVLFVIDKNVSNYHKNIFKDIDYNELDKSAFLILDSTETLKNRISLEKIYTALLDNNFGRDSIIVAAGGGIIGDVAGFAAATYMRGIQYIQVPTTLLAAVDSSVGGKTGINYSDTKNIVGAFKQPEFVLIDTVFLRTLPEREINCGIGEIIKYAFLIDESFFEFLSVNFEKLRKLDGKILERIIIESVKFKGAVVESDEKEKGLRKILNFGHTFAHAIEVDQNYKIKHGEAVVVGIVCALFLSYKSGFLSHKQLETFLSLPLRMHRDIKIKRYDLNKMIDVMSRDKKNLNDKIKFVLIKDIGSIVLDAEAPVKAIKSSIEDAMRIFN